MSQNAEYFARYEAIVAISRKMLAAARSARWSELTELEEEYLALVNGLKDAESKVMLDDAERTCKFKLIQQILANDAAIRDLLNPDLSLFDRRGPPSDPCSCRMAAMELRGHFAF
jgi:flagellar protein FliT